MDGLKTTAWLLDGQGRMDIADTHRFTIDDDNQKKRNKFRENAEVYFELVDQVCLCWYALNSKRTDRSSHHIMYNARR